MRAQKVWVWDGSRVRESEELIEPLLWYVILHQSSTVVERRSNGKSPTFLRLEWPSHYPRPRWLQWPRMAHWPITVQTAAASCWAGLMYRWSRRRDVIALIFHRLCNFIHILYFLIRTSSSVPHFYLFSLRYYFCSCSFAKTTLEHEFYYSRALDQ